MDWRRETGEGGHRRQCEPYTHDLFAVTCSANEGANLRRAAVASLDWHVHTASGPVIRRSARCARLTTASQEAKPSSFGTRTNKVSPTAQQLREVQTQRFVEKVRMIPV